MQRALGILDGLINTINQVNQTTESLGSLKCECGKVCIGLYGRLRYRLECLCCDCRNRIVICSDNNKNNHSGIQDIIDCKKGADNWYFGNSLIISKETKKLIDFFRLRNDSEMINMKSKCCGQYICAIHPFYQGNVFVTSPDGPKISLSSNIKIPSQILRCWRKDFPPAKYDQLPNDKPTVDWRDPKDREKYKDMLDNLTSVMKQIPPKTKNTTTFEELLNNEWTKQWENIQKIAAEKLKKFGLDTS